MNVTLYDKTRGYIFTTQAPCSSATLAWTTTVFPGSYDVSVAGIQGYSTIPTQAFVAQKGMTVAGADVNNVALDVKTLTAAGSITLDGAAPTPGVNCANQSTASSATVTLSDAGDGYEFTLPVPCSSTSFAWTGTIYAGTYDIHVNGVNGYSNVPTQAYRAMSSVSAASNLSGLVLDVQTRSVGGTITLNGAVPSTTTACNPSPTAAKASVVLTDATDGYSFTVPVACSASNFTFAGTVFPGTYSISVAGNASYSNLPSQSFLGTPRLAVK